MWSEWACVATASSGWPSSVADERRSGAARATCRRRGPGRGPRTCHTLHRSSGWTWGSVMWRDAVGRRRAVDEPRIGDGQVEHAASVRPIVRRRRRGARPRRPGPRPPRPARRDERRHEALGRRRAHGVAAVHGPDGCAGHLRRPAPSWRGVGTTPSSSVTTTAVGTSTAPIHGRESKRSGLPAGLDDLGPVVPADLLEPPPGRVAAAAPTVPLAEGRTRQARRAARRRRARWCRRRGRRACAPSACP